MTDTKKPSPIEAWLTQGNMQVTCRIVREDESTEPMDVDSLSMRGAQREITGYLIEQGYTPVGRWAAEHSDSDGTLESSRKFKLEAAK